MGNGCLLGAEIMNMIRQALLIVGLLLLITGAAVADEELQSGSFMIRDVNQQDYKPALLLGTEVEVKIAGPIARVVVRQTFYNQSRDYVEGKYLFPLPEQAAVNAMTMIIGDRVIKGAIHEKQQAQQIYQQALQQGKQVGLVEQQRPNLFTTQVANIAPQENILIEITYVETLVPVGNEFGFVFPMTLTPRYTPDTSIQQFDRDAETVMAARFIAKDSTSTELANPARITVEIENVEGLTAIESTSHKIKLTKNNHKWLVNTQDNFVPMDRGYKLRWKIAAEANNAPAFFMEQMGDEYFGVLMIMPPEAPKDEAVLARETIFIIDPKNRS
jgi:Ca-activated chloride channel family protein